MFLSTALAAQFAVDGNHTPENLVEQVLLGEGVESFDVTFNGSEATQTHPQIARFSGGSSIFGLESGVILATGGAEVAVGPNDFPSSHSPLPPGLSLDEEPDLQTLLAPAELRNAAVLAFSFVANGDMLRFRYVFASEEYNEYTCSSYNDVFGFFISGPGIAPDGSFENGARNLARVPGTSVPVAINTVNRGFAGDFGSDFICQNQNPDWQAHSAYFVDNAGNPDPQTTQFDGYTTPLVVEVPVICGETYHIKLAIADAVDDKNDSAVLIEANSFTSTPPLTVDWSILQPDDEGRSVEGCSSYRMKLHRIDSTSVQTVYFETHDLPNAEDILPSLPDSITFYPHQGHLSLEIPVETDGVEQGERHFSIDVIQPGACSVDTFRTSISAVVIDAPPLSVDYADEMVVDCRIPIHVEVEVMGGYPPYQIQWDHPDAEGFAFDIHPEETVDLHAVVSDRCGAQVDDISITLVPESFPPFEIQVPDSMSFNCAVPLTVPVAASGGGGNHEFLWQQDGEIIGQTNPLHRLIESDSPLELTVSARCEPPIQKTIPLSEQYNPLVVNLGEDTVGSCNEELHVIPDVSGGNGLLTYAWTVHGDSLSESPFLSIYPKRTQTIVLTVTDFCGRSTTDSIRVVIESTPPLVSLDGSLEVCSGEVLNLSPMVRGGVEPMKTSWYAETAEIGMPWLPNKSGSLWVRVTDACDQTDTDTAWVEVRDVQASFHFDYASEPSSVVNTSTGGTDVLWTFANGSTSDLFEPQIPNEPEAVGPVVLHVEDDLGCTDGALEFFDPPMHLYIPNAFTPDGDGLNDVFRAVGRNVSVFHLSIFDKWGRLVFETDDIRRGWNGASSEDVEYFSKDEVYSYRYRAQTLAGEWRKGSGHIVLIR